MQSNRGRVGGVPADEYAALSPDEQRRLLDWIAANLGPAKTPWRGRTSYGLKHDYSYAMQQAYPGQGTFYVTNGQFKGAMLAAGYVPVDPAEQNWRFCARPRRGRATRRS
jgi:hypothetical protein